MGNLMSYHTILGHCVSLKSLSGIWSLTLDIVLDPKSSYTGLLADCSNDISLKNHLELQKSQLQPHFWEHYYCATPQHDMTSTTLLPSVPAGSP